MNADWNRAGAVLIVFLGIFALGASFGIGVSTATAKSHLGAIALLSPEQIDGLASTLSTMTIAAFVGGLIALGSGGLAWTLSRGGEPADG